MSLIRKNSSINHDSSLVGQLNPEGNRVTPLPLEQQDIEGAESSKSKRCCDTVNTFLKAISLGKYQTKLYNDGEASQSSSLGGIVTLICGLMIAFYAFIVLNTIFSKEHYNIEKETRALQMYAYNQSMNLNPISCADPKHCTELTRYQIADAIFGQGDSTVIQVILPKNSSSKSCSKIRLEVFEFLDEGDSNDIATIKRYYADPIRPWVCNFPLSDAIKQNSPYWNSTISLFQQNIRGVDVAAFSITVEITNLPPGAVFNKNTLLKAEVTQLGMQYSSYQTLDCPKNSQLLEIFDLVELHDYDTVWNKNWITPKIKLGANPDNLYCSLQRPEAGSFVAFYFKTVYIRSSRIPDSIVNGLTKIGGLLAIFRIGLLLSYLHQSKFEKKLMAKLEQQSPSDEKIDLQEVKKIVSIDHFLQVINEQREVIKEMKSQNEELFSRINEIELQNLDHLKLQ